MPAFSLKLEHNMKKNLKLLLGALLLLFISFSISGCKSKSKEKPEKFTAFEKEMTNTDSMEVIRLVDQFFNYAENGITKNQMALRLNEVKIKGGK